MVRRMMAKQNRLVAEGGDPAGVIFDTADAIVRIEGGNYFEGAADAPLLAAAVED